MIIFFDTKINFETQFYEIELFVIFFYRSSNVNPNFIYFGSFVARSRAEFGIISVKQMTIFLSLIKLPHYTSEALIVTFRILTENN